MVRLLGYAQQLQTMRCAITPSKRIVSFTKLSVPFTNRTVQYTRNVVYLNKKNLP